MMFLAAIVAAFWYLRAEEAEREQKPFAVTWNMRSSGFACACWNARNN